MRPQRIPKNFIPFNATTVDSIEVFLSTTLLRSACGYCLRFSFFFPMLISSIQEMSRAVPPSIPVAQNEARIIYDRQGPTKYGTWLY